MMPTLMRGTRLCDFDSTALCRWSVSWADPRTTFAFSAADSFASSRAFMRSPVLCVCAQALDEFWPGLSGDGLRRFGPSPSSDVQGGSASRATLDRPRSSRRALGPACMHLPSPSRLARRTLALATSLLTRLECGDLHERLLQSANELADDDAESPRGRRRSQVCNEHVRRWRRRAERTHRVDLDPVLRVRHQR